MQLRHVFSELRSGLRRNLSMHLAVTLTLFISLGLVGIGNMLRMEAALVNQTLGSQLQVAVYMCSPVSQAPTCSGTEVTEQQQSAIEAAIKDNPDVESYRYESKTEALDRLKELYPDLDTEGDDAVMTEEAIPTSYWITLEDPKQADGIRSATQGLDGVFEFSDNRKQVGTIFGIIDKLRIGSWVMAGILLLAALLLVANTVRLAANARRREIGIMRLVGASSLYITLPFLLEAVVVTIFGVVFAGGAMGAFQYFVIEKQMVPSFRGLPWIDWSEFFSALVGLWPPGIVFVAPVLTLIPTLLLTRKYTKV